MSVETIDDATIGDYETPIGQCGGKFQVLFHQENGEPSRLDGFDGCGNLLDDHGGQSFGGLVQLKQRCAGSENPSDGQHLLLATGELCPRTGTSRSQVG